MYILPTYIIFCIHKLAHRALWLLYKTYRAAVLWKKNILCDKNETEFILSQSTSILDRQQVATLWYNPLTCNFMIFDSVSATLELDWFGKASCCFETQTQAQRSRIKLFRSLCLRLRLSVFVWTLVPGLVLTLVLASRVKTRPNDSFHKRVALLSLLVPSFVVSAAETVPRSLSD